ncbi:MAG: tryptophan synthase subunit alpha [Halanaerobiaceae bacterium]|nr:tryptophan synthase subunit alpha [Halanaerobiaceae bacterium]
MVFKKKALMPYITAGDPDLAMTEEIILTLDKSGADLIEIGIPFSDPLLDGPVIQESGQRALHSGTNLKKIFEMLEGLRGRIRAPYLLMGSYNPILSYGKDKFISDAGRTGVSGVIIPDLPYEQDIEFYQDLKKNNLPPIFMVTPVSTEKRLRLYGEIGSGFLYCVSLLGITGTEQGSEEEIKTYLERVRRYTDLPLALGFGINGPEKAKKVVEHVDGIIIGTALIRIIKKYAEDKELLLQAIAGFISGIKEIM